jgi:hypothetical protein
MVEHPAPGRVGELQSRAKASNGKTLTKKMRTAP